MLRILVPLALCFTVACGSEKKSPDPQQAQHGEGPQSAETEPPPSIDAGPKFDITRCVAGKDIAPAEGPAYGIVLGNVLFARHLGLVFVQGAELAAVDVGCGRIVWTAADSSWAALVGDKLVVSSQTGSQIVDARSGTALLDLSERVGAGSPELSGSDLRIRWQIEECRSWDSGDAPPEDWEQCGEEGGVFSVNLTSGAVRHVDRWLDGYMASNPSVAMAGATWGKRPAEKPENKRGPFTIDDVIASIDGKQSKDGSLVFSLRRKKSKKRLPELSLVTMAPGSFGDVDVAADQRHSRIFRCGSRWSNCRSQGTFDSALGTDLGPHPARERGHPFVIIAGLFVTYEQTTSWSEEGSKKIADERETLRAVDVRSGKEVWSKLLGRNRYVHSNGDEQPPRE